VNRAIPNIAELALETRQAARETAERRAKSAAQLAFACKLGSLDAGLYRAELEIMAAQIGLSADATGHVLGQWEYRARLLDEAHELLRALIPHEAQIRRMVSSQDAAAA
jgi:hypothetical protein